MGIGPSTSQEIPPHQEKPRPVGEHHLHLLISAIITYTELRNASTQEPFPLPTPDVLYALILQYKYRPDHVVSFFALLLYHVKVLIGVTLSDLLAVAIVFTTSAERLLAPYEKRLLGW